MLNSFLIALNQNLTLFAVFPAIILIGFYLTFRLRFVQLTRLKLSFQTLLKKNHSAEGDISHYQAIASVLAGNFGTGNISGMAVALSTGGPGSLVWMWVMAFLGTAIQYSSCLLGVKYREKNAQGDYVGGPMYYLSNGLKQKKLAILFALFAIFGAFTVGNLAQINSVVMPLKELGIHPFVAGFAMMVLVALVILGGVKRVSKVASAVVPIMALLYLGSAITILFLNIEFMPSAFKLLFNSAFDLQSITGGVLGYGLFKALTSGFDRGLFATDAGTGIVPILQAGARSPHPVIDGVATLVAPFLVMIVCTTTGLVLITTGAWSTGLKSTTMVTHAFQVGLNSSFGVYIVLTALILFAYTTILAWGYCLEKAVGFLAGSRVKKCAYFLYLILIPFGAIAHVDIVWLLADIAISFMLLVNLIGVVGLSNQVIDESRVYFQNSMQLTKRKLN